MVGYDMGVSLAGIYIAAKASLVEIFEHGWRNDMVVEVATFFWPREFYGGQVPWRH
jgi:hypothetical protein